MQLLVIQVVNLTKNIQVDMFKKYCKDNKIKLYFIISDGHLLGIINRFHRTLKEKITEHFIATKKYNWIDSLDKLIYNYIQLTEV